MWQNANVVKKPIGKIINTFFFWFVVQRVSENWVGLVFGDIYFSFRWKKREEKKRKEKEQN